jgi:iron complex transport system substrate-binding protein
MDTLIPASSVWRTFWLARRRGWFCALAWRFAIMEKGNGMKLQLGLVCALLWASAAGASITVTDDAGNAVKLEKPAQRIVSLAPHVTEMIFAAGAGERIVGAVSYSDYPEAAKAIPRIGDNRQIDMEKVLALKPDLLVVWMHGAFDKQLDQLRQMGIPYYFSEPKKLEQIPQTLEKLGSLLGTEKTANAAAQDFRLQLATLTRQNANKKKLRVFYQVWYQPIYTLNDQHIVSDALRLCGGVNVFGGLKVTAPSIATEAVVQENPDAIVSADVKSQSQAGIDIWQRYGTMQAVKNHNLFILDADELNRPGPRIIEGAQALCKVLDQARAHLATAAKP